MPSAPTGARTASSSEVSTRIRPGVPLCSDMAVSFHCAACDCRARCALGTVRALRCRGTRGYLPTAVGVIAPPRKRGPRAGAGPPDRRRRSRGGTFRVGGRGDVAGGPGRTGEAPEVPAGFAAGGIGAGDLVGLHVAVAVVAVPRRGELLGRSGRENHRRKGSRWPVRPLVAGVIGVAGRRIAGMATIVGRRCAVVRALVDAHRAHSLSGARRSALGVRTTIKPNAKRQTPNAYCWKGTGS